MRRTPVASALLVVSLGGCVGSDQARRVETPVNVTSEMAFGDYRRVFNTTYHILNRYGVIQNSSYQYGEITALVGEDTQLFDKTRRTIQARIFDAGDFFEVECRVLVSVEDSEVATFPDQFQPRYSWKTVASDPRLEVRLNNEIRAALSGGAWESKEPLRPEPIRPAEPPARRKASAAPQQGSEDTDEVRLRPGRRAASVTGPGVEDYVRLGVACLRGGSFDRAEEAFRAALELDAAAPYAHYLLAQSLFSRGEFDQAAGALAEGARVNPDWVRAPMDVRRLYGDRDSTFARQLQGLDEAAAHDPSLLFLLGYMNYFSARPDAALSALDRWIAERPADPAARAYREAALGKLSGTAALEEF